ncbi:MAG: hypothetical protein WBG17_10455 [Burkholderiaceae bacterium]
MAIGWVAVLKGVPWTEVVNNAPLVVDGARKLWKIAARKPAPADPDTDDPVTTLERKIAELEAARAELQGQMATSSELIKALAEQNTQLIQGIEALRRRLLRLTVALALAAAVAGAALALALLR